MLNWMVSTALFAVEVLGCFASKSCNSVKEWDAVMDYQWRIEDEVDCFLLYVQNTVGTEFLKRSEP